MNQTLRPGWLIRLFLVALILFSADCGRSRNGQPDVQQTLQVMSLAWEKNLLFEQAFVRGFGERNGIKTHYVPNANLALYERLLRDHSSQPDLLEIDVVWPGILADDLIDLRSYLKADSKSIAPELLASYTVRGRLVALPLLVDVGVLYYRLDLLQKYGFAQPPRTWDELERMAARIQQGERQAGKKEFWGFVWQGASAEGLVCNALEWQASAGGGNFVEPEGSIHVRGAAVNATLNRALRWMSSISPPAEYVYREDDSMNIWDAGQAAFMRNWASGYGHVSDGATKNGRRFAIAPLPGGVGGQRGTLGGLGIGVSKYAAHREMAIQALLELTNKTNDWSRLLVTGGIPIHTDLSARPDVKSLNSLLTFSAELTKGLVARPSTVTGAEYAHVSREYAKAVNSVLRHQATPEAAMAELEMTLMKITGLPAQ